MNSFFLQYFSENLDNPFIKRNEEDDQKEIIKKSSNSEYNEDFVKELFQKIHDTRVKVGINNNKKSFNYTITVKNDNILDNIFGKKIPDKKIKVNLKIEIDALGYWLCKIDGILLNNSSISVDELYTVNIGSIDDKEYYYEDGQIIFKMSDLLKTEYLYVSHRLIYPISINEFNYTLMRSNKREFRYSEYIRYCKCDIEVIIYISGNTRSLSLDEIFFKSDLFPSEINNKIDEIKNIVSLRIPNLNELEEKAKAKKNKNNYPFKSKEEEEYDQALSEFFSSIKRFFNNGDNWKVFAYAFIKQCPLNIIYE
jgi:hypothetical protein